MATTETMTVHKALAELKIIGERIDNAIISGIFCRANKHSNEKINGVSLAEFNKQIVGSWDKVNSLIKRRNAIKRAVVLSNAIQKIKVGDIVFVVAEAIEMKNTGINYKKDLLYQLKVQHAEAVKITESKNGDALQERAENYVVGLYGAKDKPSSTEEIEKTKKQFIKNNTFEIVDPIKIREKIELLEAEIAEFTAEIDAALSVSNSLTEITIEY